MEFLCIWLSSALFKYLLPFLEFINIWVFPKSGSEGGFYLILLQLRPSKAPIRIQWVYSGNNISNRRKLPGSPDRAKLRNVKIKLKHSARISSCHTGWVYSSSLVSNILLAMIEKIFLQHWIILTNKTRFIFDIRASVTEDGAKTPFRFDNEN